MEIFFHKKVKVSEKEKDSIRAIINKNPRAGKLRRVADTYHEHLTRKNVVVWNIKQNDAEVVYVGSRESATYDKW